MTARAPDATQHDRNTMARARVTMTVEFDVNGRWGNDCTVGQIYMQAGREAEAVIRTAMEKLDPIRAQVLSLKVVAVLHADKP